MTARKKEPHFTTENNKKIIYVCRNTAPSIDSKDLPTLLQWLKKQPKDRDSTVLYPVFLVFFANTFPSHTLCTAQFRARLNSTGVSYENLVDVIETGVEENSQFYVRVQNNGTGAFELITAEDTQQYGKTTARWIGNETPYLGVELHYETF